MICLGCSPSLRAAADSGTLSPQPESASARAKTRSILRLVDKAVLPDPGHHLAQARADFLDRVLGRLAPARQQRRLTGAALEHELLGVLARLDAAEDFLHALAHPGIDDLPPAH